MGVPPLCRIDIGIIPDKKCKGGVRTFVNEIEQECTTFLVRYCPFNLLDRLGVIYTEKTVELLRGRLNSGEKVADRHRVEELLDVLETRITQKAWTESMKPKKRKLDDAVPLSSKKRKA